MTESKATPQGSRSDTELVPDAKCPFCGRRLYRKLKVPKQFNLVWYCVGCDTRANNCQCKPEGSRSELAPKKTLEETG